MEINNQTSCAKLSFHSLAQALLNSNHKLSEAVKHVFVFIALLIILLTVYSNSFYADWIFDDFPNIIDNQYIKFKYLSWAEIKKCFYGLDQKSLSRPLAYLSFALNYYFDGTNVFGYHVVNFTIHYLATGFLFLFIYNTIQLPLIRDKYTHIAYPFALLATLLWAINPVFVTSITYIVQRMASMAGLFYIMSMYFYLKGRTAEKSFQSIGFFVLCFLAGLAAFFSKENAVMLPVSILLFDLFLIQSISKDNIKKFVKIAVLPLSVIFIVGLIYVDFSSFFEEYKIRNFSLTERLLTQPRVILFYLSLLFYPISSRLTLLYDIDISHSLLQPWGTLPSILFILIIIGFAFYLAKKRPLISFCIIYYFINHIIEGSIFNLELIYEHRNYLPAMLLFVPIAEFILFFIDGLSHKKIIQYACIFSTVLIIFILCHTTYIRNTIVSNEADLWLDNIEKYPHLSRPHSNLGNIYLANKRMNEALSEYEKAMALSNFGSTYAYAAQEHNLGIYYFIKEEHDIAFFYFKSSYKKMPFYHSTVIYMAKIHLLRGEYSLAHSLIASELRKNQHNLELNEFFNKTLRCGRLSN